MKGILKGAGGTEQSYQTPTGQAEAAQRQQPVRQATPLTAEGELQAFKMFVNNYAAHTPRVIET